MIQEIKIKNFLSFKEEVTFSFEATKAGDKVNQTSEKDSPKYQRENDPLVVNVAPQIDLLRFAVIYGANASGKTNLLKAIDSIFSFITFKPIYADSHIPVQQFALDSLSETEPTEFNLKFFIGSNRFWYQVILDKDHVHEENLYIYKSVQPSRIFKRDMDGIQFNQQIEPIDSVSQKQLNVNCLKNMSVFAAKKTISTPLPKIDAINTWIDTALIDMIEDSYDFFDTAEGYVQKNHAIADYLTEFLHKADFNISKIESELEKIAIPEEVIKNILSNPEAPEKLKQKLMADKYMPSLQTYFHHETIHDGIKEDHRFPSSWQSRGTQNVFSIETLLYLLNQKEDSFLAIDELERSLHPDLMNYIIKKYILQKEKRTQLLISSHFTSLLDMEELRNDCFWFAEKDKDTGASSITQLTKKKALNRRKSKEDTYLKTDNIGARPNINDSEI